MGCLNHYNWGTIKYELGPEKLFLDIKGIENFIQNMFKDVPNLDEVINAFRKEIFDTCQAHGMWGEDFRVSEVADKIGFDAKALIEKESFWLLYDDSEVTDEERTDNKGVNV